MNRKLFWVFVLGSILALSVWFLLTVSKYEQTKLIFCDVGQGNGVVLSRGEFQLLYDTGPKNGKMLSCLSENLPFWDKKLEVVIVSHWDKDHSGGLSEIEQYYRIDNLYSSKKNEQANYAKVLALGDILRNSWMEFIVISTDKNEDDNYGSVVGVIDMGDFEALLMGDVPIEVEQRLVWSRVKRDMELVKELSSIEVLLVGHHGSRESTGKELVEYLTKNNDDMEAVISVGKNSYGHPSKEVIDRLVEYGVEVKRTDKLGNIEYVIRI